MGGSGGGAAGGGIGASLGQQFQQNPMSMLELGGAGQLFTDSLAKTAGNNMGKQLSDKMIMALTMGGGLLGGIGKGVGSYFQGKEQNKAAMAEVARRGYRTPSQRRVGAQLGQRIESRLGGLQPIQPVNKRMVQRRLG